MSLRLYILVRQEGERHPAIQRGFDHQRNLILMKFTRYRCQEKSWQLIFTQTNSMSNSSPSVDQFFDNIASRYNEKYSPKYPMHYWYFTDRIQKVTHGNDFNGKVILDIGAGTGALYDFINSRSSDFEYYGNDIASEMLAHSNIPVSSRRIGISYECCSDLQSLDFVFMLGVTTYMSNREIEKTLQFVADRLKKNGKLYVTFTNSASYNVKLIKRMKPLLRKFGRNRVAGQSFDIQEFTVAKAKALIPAGLQVTRVDYLNQSFFPIAHLFGGLSAKLGKFLQRKVRNDKMLQRLSSEFIFEVRSSRF